MQCGVPTRSSHVRDTHIPVVHHHTEVVGGIAVRALDDQVVELGVLEDGAAVHQIIDHHLARQRIPEADRRRHSGRRRSRAVTPAAVVARLLLACDLPFAQRVQLLLGAVAAVCESCVEQLLDHRAIPLVALRLEIRTFVLVEPEPAHAIQDHAHRFISGALAVGVLHAQDELAAMAAGIEPGEQCSAHASDVEQAGGTGREAGYDSHGAHRVADAGAVRPPGVVSIHAVEIHDDVVGSADATRDEQVPSQPLVRTGPHIEAR